MSEIEHEHEDRLRQLERDHAYAIARIENVEGQQRAAWGELRRLSREGRDEFAALRAEMKADREDRHAEVDRIMNAINANKIAWSMMSGGQKAAAWIIGTLIGLAGLLIAGATAVRKIFTD
jgi:hypothetical protein